MRLTAPFRSTCALGAEGSQLDEAQQVQAKLGAGTP